MFEFIMTGIITVVGYLVISIIIAKIAFYFLIAYDNKRDYYTDIDTNKVLAVLIGMFWILTIPIIILLCLVYFSVFTIKNVFFK